MKYNEKVNEYKLKLKNIFKKLTEFQNKNPTLK